MDGQGKSGRWLRVSTLPLISANNFFNPSHNAPPTQAKLAQSHKIIPPPQLSKSKFPRETQSQHPKPG